LPAEKATKGEHSLTLKSGNIISNDIKVISTSKQTLSIELDEGSEITTNQGVPLFIYGTYDASDFGDSLIEIDLTLDSKEAFVLEEASGNTFEAMLREDASIGRHDLQLTAIDTSGTRTDSNKITFEVLSSSEKTLEIYIPILPLTAEGVALSFTGYYQALNFGDSPIDIKLATESEDAFDFDGFSDHTFNATLKSSASIGTHILQLVANDNVISAPFIFAVGSIYYTNGLN
jgi:hypothetical protein